MSDARPTIAVIGGGSAAEQLCRSVGDRGDLVVFEPSLVGGECPFLACMPSKAMLHMARSTGSWAEAVAHRERIVQGRDDSGHADDLRERGVDVRRTRARVAGANTVVDQTGERFDVDHIVLATGAEPIVPPIDGLDEVSDAVWTSEDLYVATERPDRVVLVGGGVIGFELADLLAAVGSRVTVVDRADRSFEAFPPAVASVVTGALGERGVAFRHGCQVESVERDEHGDRESAGAVTVVLDDGTRIGTDRIVVAVGRRPRTTDVGLDTVGVDPERPLPVGPDGRVSADGSLWAMGDVAGLGEYTHLANHHAEVIADRLVGDGTRSLDEVALGACVFTSPPLVQIGPDWAELAGDDDVVAVEVELGSFPRAMTDQLDDGHLWVAARRSTGTVVAAAGAGPSFDELVHALVVAVDGGVPVDRLRRSMQPFPTIGEILGVAFDRLHDELAA